MTKAPRSWSLLALAVGSACLSGCPQLDYFTGLGDGTSGCDGGCADAGRDAGDAGNDAGDAGDAGPDIPDVTIAASTTWFGDVATPVTRSATLDPTALEALTY